MTKTIKKSDLDKLAAQIEQLPPKQADALKQREAVRQLAMAFQGLLKKGYSIEEVYELFSHVEGADLKPETFRTYLNESVRETKKNKRPARNPSKTTGSSSLAGVVSQEARGPTDGLVTTAAAKNDHGPIAVPAIAVVELDAAPFGERDMQRTDVGSGEDVIMTKAIVHDARPEDQGDGIDRVLAHLKNDSL